MKLEGCGSTWKMDHETSVAEQEKASTAARAGRPCCRCKSTGCNTCDVDAAGHSDNGRNETGALSCGLDCSDWADPLDGMTHCHSIPRRCSVKAEVRGMNSKGPNSRSADARKGSRKYAACRGRSSHEGTSVSAGCDRRLTTGCLIGRDMLKLLKSDGTLRGCRSTTAKRSWSSSTGSDSTSSLDEWRLEGHTPNSCPSEASFTIPSTTEGSRKYAACRGRSSQEGTSVSTGCDRRLTTGCLIGRDMLKLLKSDGTLRGCRSTTAKRSWSSSTGSDSTSSLDEWRLEGHTPNSCPSEASFTIPCTTESSKTVSPEPEPFYGISDADVVLLNACNTPSHRSEAAEAHPGFVDARSLLDSESFRGKRENKAPRAPREDGAYPVACCDVPEGSSVHILGPSTHCDPAFSDSDDWADVRRLLSCAPGCGTEGCNCAGAQRLGGRQEEEHQQLRDPQTAQTVEGTQPLEGGKPLMREHELREDGQYRLAGMGWNSRLHLIERQQLQRRHRAHPWPGEEMEEACGYAPQALHSTIPGRTAGFADGQEGLKMMLLTLEKQQCLRQKRADPNLGDKPLEVV